MNLRSVLMIFGLLLVSACRSSATLAESYRTQLTPLVGSGTKDEIARLYGIPTFTQSIGTTEVWEYRRNKGMQTGRGYRSEYSREIFEKLTVAFDESGILRSWSLETQDGVIDRG